MSQSILFIVNDPPVRHRTRLQRLPGPGSAAKRDGTVIRVFLMGDSVGCAIAGQKPPDGYYKLDRMLTSDVRHGGEVGCCGTRMDAHGIPETLLVEGARRSTLEELTDWTLEADKVIAF